MESVIKGAEITVLNQSLQDVLIIDEYYSLLWPELYAEEGLFTLEVPLEMAENPYLIEGNYLVIEDSDRIMIIYDLNPVITEESSKLVVTGSSAESLLKSRVIPQTIFVDELIGSAYGWIATVFDFLFENSSISEQNVAQMDMGVTSDTNVTSKLITNTYEPQTFYNFVKSVCESTGLGFKVVFNQYGNFELQIYCGVDRSYSQSTLPFVVFSEEFENIEEQSFYISTTDFKNVAVVVTQDSVYPIVYVYEGATEPSGINRRELLVDATGITRSIPDSPDLTDTEYFNILWQKGLDEIYSRKPVGVFDGDVDVHGSFEIGVDFFLGDIVQCVFIGRETSARIKELVRSYSDAGFITYAAFEFNL